MKASRKYMKIFYNVLIFALVIAGIALVVSRYSHIGSATFTDNAQVRKNIVPVNVRIQGYVKEIRFEEYSYVGSGDTLVVICDDEYRQHLARAQAGLANAVAAKDVTEKSLAVALNNVEVARAAIEESGYQMENARREFVRYEKMYADNAVTKQQYDNVRTQYEVAESRYERSSLQKRTAELSVDELQGRLLQNEAQIRLAEAECRLAELNMSYTVITASCSGTTGRRQIHEGQLVQPGQTLLTMVDSEDIWVIANYRERQMKNIRPGYRVSVSVDAVSGITYRGTVESVSDATGAAYSIFPQDNATGNFVKTEQRIPVRIRLEGNSREDMALLSAGMNVECQVEEE